MERDYGKEIDQLKEQVEALVKLLSEKQQKAAPPEDEPTEDAPSENQKSGDVYIMRDMHPDPHLSALMEDLCVKAGEKNTSGLMSYLGVYRTGGNQSNWIRHEVPVEDLFSLVESGVAEKVLACIGSANRLALLLEILRGPKTVAELVEKCGFTSTGQVYHHLKPLLAADLFDEEKGRYKIKPHRVQGIIMLLAGISDMVDETYTQGAWEESTES